MSIATSRKRLPSGPSSCFEKAREDEELPWMSTAAGPCPADPCAAIRPSGVSIMWVFICLGLRFCRGGRLVCRPAPQKGGTRSQFGREFDGAAAKRNHVDLKRRHSP